MPAPLGPSRPTISPAIPLWIHGSPRCGSCSAFLLSPPFVASCTLLLTLYSKDKYFRAYTLGQGLLSSSSQKFVRIVGLIQPKFSGYSEPPYHGAPFWWACLFPWLCPSFGRRGSSSDLIPAGAVIFADTPPHQLSTHTVIGGAFHLKRKRLPV